MLNYGGPILGDQFNREDVGRDLPRSDELAVRRESLKLSRLLQKLPRLESAGTQSTQNAATRMVHAPLPIPE